VGKYFYKKNKINFIINKLFFFFLKLGVDSLTITVYVLMNIMMYFYFVYVCVLTIGKEKFPSLINKNKRMILLINKVLNIFFTFFWWVFFTPYIEINSGIIGNQKKEKGGKKKVFIIFS
jgi:hypothetical protein